MKFKPPELAIIVGTGLNDGKIVTVLHALGDGPMTINGRKVTNSTGEPCWLIKAGGMPIRTTTAGSFVTGPFPEKFLKPLRGGTGEDEMLRLVGKPKGTPA